MTDRTKGILFSLAAIAVSIFDVVTSKDGTTLILLMPAGIAGLIYHIKKGDERR